jgi:hypothetical protein
MITITNLICHRDIDMALLSLKSFVHNYKDSYTINLYQDGTLTEEDMILLLDIPKVNIKIKKEVDEQADEELKNYPFCRQWRGQNAFTIKLFDMALIENDDFVYFDSDVFFLKPFTGLNRKAAGYESLVLMSDRFDYYSMNYYERYIHPRIKFPDKINAGFYYLKRGTLDLDLFEWIFSKQEFFPRDKELWRVSLADQTAWALLAAKKNASIWQKNQVLIPTSMGDIQASTIAVHIIKRLAGFNILYAGIKSLLYKSNQEAVQLETEKVKFKNLFSAAVDRIKFKLTQNK